MRQAQAFEGVRTASGAVESPLPDGFVALTGRVASVAPTGRVASVASVAPPRATSRSMTTRPDWPQAMPML